MKNLGVTALLLFVALTSPCLAQMSVTELSESIDKRHASLRNLKFNYNVRYKAKLRNTATPSAYDAVFDTNGRFVKSRDEFELLGLWEGSAWMRYTRNRSGRLLLDRFEGAEGTTAACFWRPLNRFERNQVRIQTGNGFCNFGFLDGHNTFPQFLFMRINGITEWESHGQLTDEMRDFNLDHYKIARRERVDGRYVYLLKAEGIAGNPQWPYRYEAEVSGAPEFLVLRWEAIDENDQAIASYIVKKVGKIGDVSYPAVGTHFNTTVAPADLEEYVYEFEVRSASELAASERTGIFPSWPTNTLVVDSIHDATYYTPRISIARQTTRRRAFAIYAFLGAVFAFAVLIAVWFAWSMRKFHVRLAGFVVVFTVPTIVLCWFWDELIASAYATVVMLALAISIIVRTVFGTSVVSINRAAESRIGAREWIMLALSPPYVWLLVAHPELSRGDILLALAWGTIGILLLLVLFRAWLANQIRFRVIATSALFILVALFVWLHEAAGQADEAWQIAASHFAALICVMVPAAIGRTYGFRITSDRRLEVANDSHNPVAFGLVELFVWITAIGSSMAVLGLLSQAY